MVLMRVVLSLKTLRSTDLDPLFFLNFFCCQFKEVATVATATLTDTVAWIL